MAIVPNPHKTTGIMGWIDDRFPATKLWKDHLTEYYAPKNFNFWYYFGSLALLVLVNQLITGIWLAMHYKPDAKLAFDSVEYIMRDVPWGNILRYMHSTGASAFFLVVYLHMFRGLLYGSHKKPRELIWIFGCLIYLVLMAEGFCGYVLPWGQMSYWGANVIFNLFGTIPFIGPDLVIWIQGDYIPSDATLSRLFSLHVVFLPFALVGLVVAHLIALHEVGSNNPDGVDIKKFKDPVTHIPLDGIGFHPYYTVKDIVGVCVFLILFVAVICFAPDGGGYLLEKPNFQEANPLVTPEHIAPAWYFGAFYAMLRATPSMFSSALPGVIVMFGAVLILFLLPWLDKNPVKSIRYKGTLTKVTTMVFAADFVMLNYVGLQPPTALFTLLSQIGTIYYFAYFIGLMFFHKFEKSKPVPERVTS
ncbi:ubiquinol-cytochrome c reductase cytochrome b subunit [Panacagrimonas perspica]|uniref:Cytochrome b n=1 Tax=Panacagrimonas perspica TaxID=381431 RepID=A0A4S3K270_9GAMM|nr:cytochrome bc complex cytochrome b subunit [Panacagrimonas perspica]TDU26452.1 ubiquinol-cytochrome c reductase cytochrome b subunit [Panacagrimonas perspica]THD02073.1 cytochrome b [Panacagrimonas perspica]